MSIPTRPVANTAVIQSATDQGQMYKATLQDGTVLWIPKEQDNNDCAQMLAWAQAANITL